MDPSYATALWYSGPCRAELREIAMPAVGPDMLVVRMLWSGISRGTERLVFEGRVPPSEYIRMRCSHQEGDFPFPVKYGYCAVGVVEDGPAPWLGRMIFALHPHQTRFVLPASEAILVPESIPPRRALLAAHMETALNAVWDSGAGPADRIVIVGGGIVGLLTAFLCARLPGAEVTLVDLDPGREDIARRLGCRFAFPSSAPGDADVVFHASASAEGLATAIGCAGFEARIVEMSWHGAGETPIPLGGAFHSQRLTLVSSQVGCVSPSRRPRWPLRRRLEAAITLLEDEHLEGLLGEIIDFHALPGRLFDIFNSRYFPFFTTISYERLSEPALLSAN